jgi:hypothetical protein
MVLLTRKASLNILRADFKETIEMNVSSSGQQVLHDTGHFVLLFGDSDD